MKNYFQIFLSFVFGLSGFKSSHRAGNWSFFDCFIFVNFPFCSSPPPLLLPIISPVFRFCNQVSDFPPFRTTWLLLNIASPPPLFFNYFPRMCQGRIRLSSFSVSAVPNFPFDFYSPLVFLFLVLLWFTEITNIYCIGLGGS